MSWGPRTSDLPDFTGGHRPRRSRRRRGPRVASSGRPAESEQLRLLAQRPLVVGDRQSIVATARGLGHAVGLDEAAPERVDGLTQGLPRRSPRRRRRSRLQVRRSLRSATSGTATRQNWIIAGTRSVDADAVVRPANRTTSPQDRKLLVHEEASRRKLHRRRMSIRPQPPRGRAARRSATRSAAWRSIANWTPNWHQVLAHRSPARAPRPSGRPVVPLVYIW